MPKARAESRWTLAYRRRIAHKALSKLLNRSTINNIVDVRHRISLSSPLALTETDNLLAAFRDLYDIAIELGLRNAD